MVFQKGKVSGVEWSCVTLGDLNQVPEELGQYYEQGHYVKECPVRGCCLGECKLRTKAQDCGLMDNMCIDTVVIILSKTSTSCSLGGCSFPPLSWGSKQILESSDNFFLVHPHSDHPHK